MLDPEYLRLYRRYAKAIRAYEIQLNKRRQLRAAEHAKRTPQKRLPSSRKGSTGESIGSTWATTDGRFRTTVPAMDMSDVLKEFDVDAHYTEIQRQLYLNARDHYLRCKKEFFDYVRRGSHQRGGKRPTRGYRKNLARARGHTEYAAELQVLGFEEGAAEEPLRLARLEVENACYKLWDNYQKDPNNEERIKDLIKDCLVEAQFTGIEGSPIVNKAWDEIHRLMNSKRSKFR